MSLELQSHVKYLNAENSVLLIPVVSVFDYYYIFLKEEDFISASRRHRTRARQ